jgi:hypothetical protein
MQHMKTIMSLLEPLCDRDTTINKKMDYSINVLGHPDEN